MGVVLTSNSWFIRGGGVKGVKNPKFEHINVSMLIFMLVCNTNFHKTCANNANHYAYINVFLPRFKPLVQNMIT